MAMLREGSIVQVAPPKQLERRKNKQDIAQFRTEFSLPEEEEFVTKFPCALEHRTTTFPGNCYLFQNHLCFISPSKARVVKVSIPLEDINSMEKSNTAYVISNLIKIDVGYIKVKQIYII